MSIIIKANELNILIYKYFLETGLSHSAYTLFNEAALTQPLQEYRFDIRAGHLMSVLEKGLVYNKLESHVNMGQYQNCEQPFYLLKPHTCKIVERVKKQRSELMRELDQSLSDGIRRTNSIYNTAIVNRQIEDIFYEAKGGKYFQKFAKIKLPANDGQNQTQPSKIVLAGCQLHTLLYNADDYEVDLLKYDSINEELKIDRIFPSVREGELARSVDEVVSSRYIIQLFDGNHVTFFDLKDPDIKPIEFNLPTNTQLSSIEPNPNIPQLVCFKNADNYCVVNLNTFKVICRGQGQFYWRCFDEFLVVSGQQILQYSLKEQQPVKSFESDVLWEDIKFNENRTLFAAISYRSQIMQIYTFDSQQPLFIFSFQDKKLKQVLFVTSNSVDFFCWLTNESITVFDLSLNAYSKVIEIEDYDVDVRGLSAVKKGERDQMYLLCLGADNLLIYDLSNSKIERIELEARVLGLKQLSRERVAMMTESNIYILVGQYMDPLFK